MKQRPSEVDITAEKILLQIHSTGQLQSEANIITPIAIRNANYTGEEFISCPFKCRRGKMTLLIKPE